MRKNIWISIVLLVAVLAPLGQAQTLEKLKTDLDSARSDAQSLERILQELSVLDSAYTPSFPSWEMDEPNLRLRVVAAFRNRGKQFSKNDKIMITTMPDSQTIIDIKIGDVGYGKLYSQTLLARDLRTDLLAEAKVNEPPEGLKSRVSEESNPMARPSKPDWVSADFSLFGMSMRFGNDWGIVGRIGDDELGYLWWSTGNARIMGAYKSLKIGAWVPVLGGLSKDDVEGTGRLINGSDGLVGEFEFEWETIRINSESFPYAAIGGSFAVGGLTGRRLEFLTPNIDSLYYLARIIQGYYAFDFLFDEKRQNLNVHLGASYHQVNIGKAVIIDDGYKIFKGGEPESFIDPLIRIEYRNYRFDRFRVTAQFTRLLMFSGWAEVVPPFLYAEIRFSAVVFRNPRAWEHSSYVMGTLGVKFDF
jgi:hypothetical protein